MTELILLSTTILKLTLLTLAVVVIKNQPQYENALEKLKLNRKPWNCGMCLALWTSLAAQTLLGHINIWTIPLALAMSFIGAELDKKYNTY